MEEADQKITLHIKNWISLLDEGQLHFKIESQLQVPPGQPFHFHSPAAHSSSAVGVLHLDRKLRGTQPEIRRGCNYFYKGPLIRTAETQSLSLSVSLLINLVIAPLRL